MKHLLVSYHGLGDNILLTPVLRKYKEENPQTHIGFTHLKRLPVNELLEECPYIDEFFPISDAWNDFPDFNIGFNSVVEEAKAYADKNEYNKVIVITTSPEIGLVHKIHRATHELGITIEDYTTEIFPKITGEIKEQADKFLENIDAPYVFLHLKTGNSPKDINRETIANFLVDISPTQTIEYGSRIIPSHHLPLGNIPLEMEILSRCCHVICADSFIMHAACALGIPTQAIFLSTPPEWVIPLHDANIDIYKKV
jgi:ADP-heptose:LPS heptosyltransferase